MEIDVEVYKSAAGLEELVADMKRTHEVVSSDCFSAFLSAQGSPLIVEVVEPSTVAPRGGSANSIVRVPPPAGVPPWLRFEEYVWRVGNVYVEVDVEFVADEFSPELVQAAISVTERSLERVFVEAALEQPATGAN